MEQFTFHILPKGGQKLACRPVRQPGGIQIAVRDPVDGSRRQGVLS
jgi:hypothetical protein